MDKESSALLGTLLAAGGLGLSLYDQGKFIGKATSGVAKKVIPHLSEAYETVSDKVSPLTKLVHEKVKDKGGLYLAGGLATAAAGLALYNYLSDKKEEERYEDIYMQEPNNESVKNYLDFLKESSLRPTRLAYAIKLATGSGTSDQQEEEVTNEEVIEAGNNAKNALTNPTSSDDDSDVSEDDSTDSQATGGSVFKNMFKFKMPDSPQIGNAALALAGVAGVGYVGKSIYDYFADAAERARQNQRDADYVRTLGKNKSDVTKMLRQYGAGDDAARIFERDAGRKNLDELIELQRDAGFLEPEDIALMRTLAEAKKKNPEYYRQLGKTVKTFGVPNLKYDAKSEESMRLKDMEIQSLKAQRAADIEAAKKEREMEIQSLKAQRAADLEDAKKEREKLIEKMEDRAKGSGTKLRETWDSLSPYGKAGVVAVPTLASLYGGYRVVNSRNRRRGR